ncbi:ring finger domain-containing protein [Sarocladium implicatum]|nr:ring finger domain-containing protein [Sarocladium implicatum]
MRPPRMLILIIFLTGSLFVLCRSVASLVASASRTPSDRYPDAPTGQEPKKEKGIWGFMYYNTPFSLFPPNAAISLTDDNSTSFAARPAAFGPNFNPKGLSGQLWVGSGFSEDATDTAGELGCNDVPGWDSLGGGALLRTAVKVAQADAAPSGQVPDPNHFPGARRDDARYLEEFNDIQGKVVLLMRGGCGFLEKVMWAQRRGAIAVIVGDSQRGGPLIQMFAHGDEVDNVTIPSVFTARTTAQLLSSLTQPGSFIEDTIDDYGKPMLKVRQGPIPASRAQQSRDALLEKKRSFFKPRSGARVPRSAWGTGWLSRILGRREPSLPHADDIRPPSSAQSSWSVDEWDKKDDIQPDGESDDVVTLNESGQAQVGRQSTQAEETAKRPEGDESTSPASQSPSVEGKDVSEHSETLPVLDSEGVSEPVPKASRLPTEKKEAGILAKLFGGETDEDVTGSSYLGSDDEDYSLNDIPDFTVDDSNTPNTHEGLWVTITPTSSASPFFDTLLVLVISPLVTLTVVYALLILRARIRRRRWRAPKSIVEQLPVRTYRTVLPSPVLSPQIPASPAATPTTPLLSNASRARPRPRSRTTTGVFDADTLFTPTPAIPTPRPSSRDGPPQPEKGSGGFSAEWKKYMGRQVECVVCLEEYVDGVSRVMSLPCGHEFHVDCITPWLTTRRRTCPICKGDVVRSLARGSPSSPRYEPYHDDSDDEPDAEGSRARSTDDSDLEQGVAPEERDGRSTGRLDGWLGLLSSSFSSRSQQRSRSPADRNR